METIKYQDMDCIPLENAALRLLVTQSVGPRILSLRRGFISCPKLAALPDAVRAQFRGRFEVVTADGQMRTASADEICAASQPKCLDKGMMKAPGRPTAPAVVRLVRKATPATTQP